MNIKHKIGQKTKAYLEHKGLFNSKGRIPQVME